MNFSTCCYVTVLENDDDQCIEVVTFSRGSEWFSEIREPGKYYSYDSGDYKVICKKDSEGPFLQSYAVRPEAERGHRHIVLRLERGELELGLHRVSPGSVFIRSES
jgi:hypothetical protein